MRHLLCFYTLIKRQLEHIRASTIFNATLGTTDADLGIDSASQQCYFVWLNLEFSFSWYLIKKKIIMNFFFFQNKVLDIVKWKMTTIQGNLSSRYMWIKIKKTRFACKISSSSDSIMLVKPMRYLHNFQDVQKLPFLTISICFQLSALSIAWERATPEVVNFLVGKRNRQHATQRWSR